VKVLVFIPLLATTSIKEPDILPIFMNNCGDDMKVVEHKGTIKTTLLGFDMTLVPIVDYAAKDIRRIYPTTLWMVTLYGRPKVIYTSYGHAEDVAGSWNKYRKWWRGRIFKYKVEQCPTVYNYSQFLYVI